MIARAGERATRALLACAVALLLGGCAGAAAPRAAQPTPTATAACPQQEGVGLPPGCAPYDPDKAMAQNERFRDRTEITAESRAAAEAVIITLRPTLEKLRGAGEVAPDAVQAALLDAGLDGIQLIGDDRGTEFSAYGPEGGCIFGVVSHEPLTVDVGGYVLDGGCFTPRGGH